MKKFLAGLIAGIMILSLVACGGAKGVKVTLLEDSWEDEQFSVDFFYPENAGIKVERDEDYAATVDMDYEAKNITISASLCEDTTFKENKKYDKENQEDYKEFKINGYDCYGYEAFGGYWIYVHLEEISETTDRYLIIDTETIDYSKKYIEGKAQYEDKDVKKIIESFVYNSVVEPEK